MNGMLVRIWKDVVVAHLKVLSHYSTGEIQENHYRISARGAGTRWRFEQGTPRARSSTANHYNMTSCFNCRKMRLVPRLFLAVFNDALPTERSTTFLISDASQANEWYNGHVQALVSMKLK
jgi:hypothetical protein